MHDLLMYPNQVWNDEINSVLESVLSGTYTKHLFLDWLYDNTKKNKNIRVKFINIVGQSKVYSFKKIMEFLKEKKIYYNGFGYCTCGAYHTDNPNHHSKWCYEAK